MINFLFIAIERLFTTTSMMIGMFCLRKDLKKTRSDLVKVLAEKDFLKEEEYEGNYIDEKLVKSYDVKESDNKIFAIFGIKDNSVKQSTIADADKIEVSKNKLLFYTKKEEYLIKKEKYYKARGMRLDYLINKLDVIPVQQKEIMNYYNIYNIFHDCLLPFSISFPNNPVVKVLNSEVIQKSIFSTACFGMIRALFLLY